MIINLQKRIYKIEKNPEDDSYMNKSYRETVISFESNSIPRIGDIISVNYLEHYEVISVIRNITSHPSIRNFAQEKLQVYVEVKRVTDSNIITQLEYCKE